MEVADDFELDGDLPRKLLQSVKTVQHVIDVIKKSKKIIVITGAGISVSSGIPDFRSKDVGLYNTLDCDLYNIPSAELLFDYEFFRIDAEPFYKFASKLIPDENIRPSPCHNFIAGLEARGKLLRNYTQNVDGLERKAGISRVIECHGSMVSEEILASPSDRHRGFVINCHRGRREMLPNNNSCFLDELSMHGLQAQE